MLSLMAQLRFTILPSLQLAGSPRLQCWDLGSILALQHCQVAWKRWMEKRLKKLVLFLSLLILQIPNMKWLRHISKLNFDTEIVFTVCIFVVYDSILEEYNIIVYENILIQNNQNNHGHVLYWARLGHTSVLGHVILKLWVTSDADPVHTGLSKNKLTPVTANPVRVSKFFPKSNGLSCHRTQLSVNLRTIWSLQLLQLRGSQVQHLPAVLPAQNDLQR